MNHKNHVRNALAQFEEKYKPNSFYVINEKNYLILSNEKVLASGKIVDFIEFIIEIIEFEKDSKFLGELLSNFLSNKHLKYEFVLIRKMIKNKHLSEHHLIEAYNKTYEDLLQFQIRCEIAKNPQTPIEILEKLTKETFGSVKLNLINNPKITKNLLEILTKDENKIIKKTAQEKLYHSVVK